MLITEAGECHIHFLRAASATDTFCSCVRCGLISDHEIGGTYISGPVSVIVLRHCAGCGSTFACYHDREEAGR